MNERTAPWSRRRFLQCFGGLAASPWLGSLSTLAFGATATDYRAIVCIHLSGGNDAHNMVVPLDARYAKYVAARGPLALPRNSLESNAILDSAQGPFGLHPRLPRAANLYGAGKLAIISNVGVLVRPTTRLDFRNQNSLPPQLFSHNDMVSHWSTCHPQVPVATGWAGRLADLLKGANTGKLSIGVATNGSGVLLKGASTMAVQVAAYSPSRTIANSVRAYGSNYYNGGGLQSAFETALTMPRRNVLEDQYSDLAVSSLETNDLVLNALYSGPDNSGKYSERYTINTVFPTGNDLAMQLRSVAMMVAGRKAMGVTRQIFFVSIPYGFDTHNNQFEVGTGMVAPGPNDPPILFGTHADTLEKVDVALKAFYDATVELGVANNVTTFTTSDFGRTLTSNGKGSDHGWGGHHFVLGGGVNGGKIYGNFHNMELGDANPLDAGQGRLIPQISVDQYAGTLARWLGASSADLSAVLPNLANFPQADLGFMA